MSGGPRIQHLDFDGAWGPDSIPDRYLNLASWGPRLRYSTTRSLVREFLAEFSDRLTPFTLYGSGDFHHLSALWLTQFQRPLSLVSFDNHPDWDVRPPHWCCGTWINRALELPHVETAAVWGCGNFELNWPHRFFGNRRAIKSGRLSLHPWTERLAPSSADHWPRLNRENWQAEFSRFVDSIATRAVYITIDMDCLRESEAVSNWEHGLFSIADLEWAIGLLKEKCEVIGGDLCGAYSPQSYDRWKQRIEARLDHPKLALPDSSNIQEKNKRVLAALWPLLTSCHQQYACAD